MSQTCDLTVAPRDFRNLRPKCARLSHVPNNVMRPVLYHGHVYCTNWYCSRNIQVLNMINLGTKQWEAPLNYCTMEYEVVGWVCTIAPTWHCTLVIHTHYWAPECHNGTCNTRMSVSAYMRAESSISISTSLFWPVLVLVLKVPIPESRIRFCLNYLLVFDISKSSDLNVFRKVPTWMLELGR